MSWILFFVGVLEMWVVSAWTESVSQRKVLKSGAYSFVNIILWYTILRIVIDDIHNYWVLVVYAIGCACGTMLKVLLSKRKRK